LRSLLNRFLKEPCESEVLEFKTAGNDYNFDKLGKYFSALSNEANMHSMKDEYLCKSKEFACRLKLKHDERKCDLSNIEATIKKVKDLAKSIS